MTAPSAKLLTSGTEVPIAGVPWPLYTMNPAPAVVAAAASATVVWLGLGLFHTSDG
jgi:hypothetical protein